MNSPLVQIVDQGRGPQIAGSRLTVLDVFYYLHRGYDFDFIQRALPSLLREEFDAAVDYVQEHHDELVEKDRLAEERIRQGILEQKAKNIYREIDESVPEHERREQLRHLTWFVSFLTSLIELGEGISGKRVTTRRPIQPINDDLLCRPPLTTLVVFSENVGRRLGQTWRQFRDFWATVKTEL